MSRLDRVILAIGIVSAFISVGAGIARILLLLKVI